MDHELFVRDFAPDTDVADLEALFSQVGNVQSSTLTERLCKGVPRHVAYIAMSSHEEVRDCIERFHGSKAEGYTLTVTENKKHVPDPNFSFKRHPITACPARRPKKA